MPTESWTSRAERWLTSGASRAQYASEDDYEREPRRFPLIGALNGRRSALHRRMAHAAGFAHLLILPGKGLTEISSPSDGRCLKSLRVRRPGVARPTGDA